MVPTRVIAAASSLLLLLSLAPENATAQSAIDQAKKLVVEKNRVDVLFGVIERRFAVTCLGATEVFGGVSESECKDFVFRIILNRELERAIRTAADSGIRVLLWNKFYVDAQKVYIDHRATDREIVEFLVGKKPN